MEQSPAKMKRLSVIESQDFEAEDDSSHNAHTNSGNSFTDETNDGSKGKKETFVEKQTRYVLLLRFLVLFILVCAAIAISVVVLKITQSGEKDNFESQYFATGRKVTGKFWL